MPCAYWAVVYITTSIVVMHPGTKCIKTANFLTAKKLLDLESKATPGWLRIHVDQLTFVDSPSNVSYIRLM